MNRATGAAPRAAKGAAAYVLLVGLPLAGLVGVLAYGGRLVPPLERIDGAITAPVAVNAMLQLPVFLAQIVVVIVVSRLFGRAFRVARQPQVIGEMVAGLALGPSFLGAVAPALYQTLFPIGTVRFLTAVSQVGLVIFMFLIGLELRPSELRGKGHAALLTSHASIAMPLLLGAAVSLLLYPRLATAGVPFVGFALFVGTAMSVTAFPVMARLLAEHGLERTPVGTIAIACAAVDDVTAWCLLAVVTALVRDDLAPLTIARTLVAVAGFTFVMFRGVGPLLRWVINHARRDDDLGHDALAAIFAVTFAAAWFTDILGVHALFGAFMAGLVMPKDEVVMRTIRRQTETLLLVLLLPLFFVATGIRTNVGLIAGVLPLLGWTVVAAVAGKLGGSTVAARAAGFSWREGLAIGSLMNARGLVGLVVINVGLERGVISPTVYAMLVATALVTTIMASPMISLLYPDSWRRPAA